MQRYHYTKTFASDIGVQPAQCIQHQYRIVSVVAHRPITLWCIRESLATRVAGSKGKVLGQVAIEHRRFDGLVKAGASQKQQWRTGSLNTTVDGKTGSFKSLRLTHERAFQVLTIGNINIAKATVTRTAAIGWPIKNAEKLPAVMISPCRRRISRVGPSTMSITSGAIG